MGDAPHGPLVFGEEDADTPNGPIFEVTSEDGSIAVVNPTGPIVDLSAVVQPYGSIVLTNAMGTVPQGTWVQVPFNVAGPVDTLIQNLGAGASIEIPEDEGGDYDCEYSLCITLDDVDGGSTGILFVLTTGGAPAGGNTLPGSGGAIAVANHMGPGLPWTHCVHGTVLAALVDSDTLELWAFGTNPPASDPIGVAASTGSLEAVRLKKVIPE